MKIGSLFDGIGGFPLVASWYGITATWASEIENAPVSITKRHFPNMKHLGDITKVNGGEIEPVDIITFGSPCQDLSVAGKRAGLAGARSGLFGEAIRIIEEMRDATNGLYPTWAIWENVPGALSSNDGLDFRAVLQSFADTEIPMPASGRWADAGMVRGGECDFGWRVLDAQFWGVPQRRKRIFLVADFRGQRASEILFKPESVRGYFKTSGTQGQGTPGTAENSVGIAGATNTAICIAGNTIDRQPQNGGNGRGFQKDIAYTLTALDRHAVYSFDSLASNSMKSSNPHSGCRETNISRTLDTTVPDASKNQGGIVIMDQHAVLASGKSATGTLMANCGTKLWLGNQEAFSGDYSIINNNTVRRLTPLECERLQGYPDYWTKFGHDGKEISDGARYKACGNSLALPCVEYFISGISELAADAINRQNNPSETAADKRRLYHGT